MLKEGRPKAFDSITPTMALLMPTIEVDFQITVLVSISFE